MNSKSPSQEPPKTSCVNRKTAHSSFSSNKIKPSSSHMSSYGVTCQGELLFYPEVAIFYKRGILRNTTMLGPANEAQQKPELNLPACCGTRAARIFSLFTGGILHRNHSESFNWRHSFLQHTRGKLPIQQWQQQLQLWC